MKLLILTNISDGLYLFRKELIEELSKKYEVSASMPVHKHREDLEEIGCRIIDTPMERRGINPLKDLGLLKGYFNLIKREKPDMVITYTIKPNIYGGFACRLLNIPYAVNITGLGTAFQKRGALRKLVTLMYK